MNIGFLLFWHRSKVPIDCSFNLEVVFKVAFGFKFQWIAKIEVFSQGTDDSINLRYKSLIIIDYKYKEIPLLLRCKVMAERR